MRLGPVETSVVAQDLTNNANPSAALLEGWTLSLGLVSGLLFGQPGTKTGRAG